MIAIVILIAILFMFSEAKEHFYLIGKPTRFEFPTKNMSYDLRGDPFNVIETQNRIENSMKAYYPPEIYFHSIILK